MRGVSKVYKVAISIKYQSDETCKFSRFVNNRAENSRVNDTTSVEEFNNHSKERAIKIDLT
jgi:hypothetical protein